MLDRSSLPNRIALPPAPVGLEVACGYLADALATQAAHGDPVVASRDLEEAARQLARTARSAGLPPRAIVTWLVLVGAVAFSGVASSAELARQLNAWAADEFALGASQPNADGRGTRPRRHHPIDGRVA